MIVRDRFMRVGRLAGHLARTDTNRKVTVRADLCRNLPPDIPTGLTIVASIARTNELTKRHILHFKASPELDNPDAIHETLRWIERIFGIRADAPRLVVEHDKGDRPAHFHIIYSIVDLQTGRALSSEDNYLKDEVISRILEIKLGERIVPGTRHPQVVDYVRTLGLEREADVLAQYEPARSGERMETGTRRQIERAGLNEKDTSRLIYDIWIRTAADRGAFSDAMGKAGYDLVRGDNALLAVERKTGVPIPLRRLLNERSKSAGASLSFKKATFDDLFDVNDNIRQRRSQIDEMRLAEARGATEEEMRRLAREALLDGDPRRASRCLGALAYRLAHNDPTRDSTEPEVLAEMKREHNRLAILRQTRVDRAFRVTGIIDTREMRKLVFAAAAAGAVLTGGGLGLALIAGGVAVAMLPRREYARALARQARLHRAAEAQIRANVIASARAAREEARTRVFGSRNQHVLAGMAFEFERRATARNLQPHEKEILKEVNRALGAKSAAAIRLLARRRDASRIGRHLRLTMPRSHGEGCEAAAIFRGRGRLDIADRLDPTTAMIMATLGRSVGALDDDAGREEAAYRGSRARTRELGR